MIDQNLIATLRQSAPSSRLVVLTSVFEPHSFVVTMLQQVNGYLLKDSVAQGELVREALALIARFGVVVTDSSIAGQFWSYPGVPIAVHLPIPAALTTREVQVLMRAIGGETDKQIAEHFSVSRSAIEYHIGRIGQKLGATCRIQLGWILHERNVL